MRAHLVRRVAALLLLRPALDADVAAVGVDARRLGDGAVRGPLDLHQQRRAGVVGRQLRRPPRSAGAKMASTSGAMACTPAGSPSTWRSTRSSPTRTRQHGARRGLRAQLEDAAVQALQRRRRGRRALDHHGADAAVVLRELPGDVVGPCPTRRRAARSGRRAPVGLRDAPPAARPARRRRSARPRSSCRRAAPTRPS